MVRVGVIGLGVMGSRHAQVCSELQDVELIGVADIKGDAVQRVSEQLKVPGYTDYKVLLDQPGLEAVVVATSDQFHREPCERAASRGLHILLEKPIATTLEDGEAILKAVAESGVKLMVGHTLRFDPRYIAVQQAAASGKLGDIIHVYARRNATVWSGRRIEGRAEVVVFHGVHDIDFLHWMTGATVTTVYAESVSKALTELGVADTIMATLRFSTGAIGLLEQSWGLPYGLPSLLDAQLEVVGTEGAAYIDMRASSISMFTDGNYTQPDVILFGPVTHLLRDEYECFLAYLAGQSKPGASGKEALEALYVAEAITRSAETGKPIQL
jgi:predicted dehydrogenase